MSSSLVSFKTSSGTQTSEVNINLRVNNVKCRTHFLGVGKKEWLGPISKTVQGDLVIFVIIYGGTVILYIL